MTEMIRSVGGGLAARQPKLRRTRRTHDVEPTVLRRNLLTGLAISRRRPRMGPSRTPKGTKLVLLGTGSGPIPGLPRRMGSSLILYRGAASVVDCGLGRTNQYARTGIPFGALRAIFITHHHPDHNVEYGPLLIIGWISGMRQAVRAYGPPPLMQMTEDYFRSEGDDLSEQRICA